MVIFVVSLDYNFFVRFFVSPRSFQCSLNEILLAFAKSQADVLRYIIIERIRLQKKFLNGANFEGAFKMFPNHDLQQKTMQTRTTSENRHKRKIEAENHKKRKSDA